MENRKEPIACAGVKENFDCSQCGRRLWIVTDLNDNAICPHCLSMYVWKPYGGRWDGRSVEGDSSPPDGLSPGKPYGGSLLSAVICVSERPWPRSDQFQMFSLVKAAIRGGRHGKANGSHEICGNTQDHGG